MTNKKNIEEIAKEDGRYSPEALKFVFEGLGATIRRIVQAEGEHPDPRHITGKEFAEGLGQLSLERWGRLGRMVLNHWGIRTTRDFGEIVFLMIKNEWMTSQETDAIEDFDNVFDFETVFEKQFNFEMG